MSLTNLSIDRTDTTAVAPPEAALRDAPRLILLRIVKDAEHCRGHVCLTHSNKCADWTAVQKREILAVALQRTEHQATVQ